MILKHFTALNFNFENIFIFIQCQTSNFFLRNFIIFLVKYYKTYIDFDYYKIIFIMIWDNILELKRGEAKLFHQWKVRNINFSYFIIENIFFLLFFNFDWHQTFLIYKKFIVLLKNPYLIEKLLRNLILF
jgi:hypothetical protein